MKKLKFQKTARHVSKLNGSLRHRSPGLYPHMSAPAQGSPRPGRWPSKIWELVPKNPGFSHAQIEPMNQPDTRTYGKIPFSDYRLANLCFELSGHSTRLAGAAFPQVAFRLADGRCKAGSFARFKRLRARVSQT